jgi:hypothetical protein
VQAQPRVSAETPRPPIGQRHGAQRWKSKPQRACRNAVRSGTLQGQSAMQRGGAHALQRPSAVASRSLSTRGDEQRGRAAEPHGLR